MLADYATAVADLVRDKDQVLSEPQRDAAIAAAVLKYSDDRPRVAVLDVISVDGGFRLELPPEWVADFSRLLVAEYPVGNIPATLLEPTAVTIYQSPTAELLQLPVAVAAGDVVRLSIAIPHQVTDVVDTVPLRHRQAVALLAAATVCDQFAAAHASDGEPTIQADTVQHGTKSQTWAARAREYRKQYGTLVGVADKPAPIAATVVNWNNTDSRGQPRLFGRLPR